MKTKEQQRLRRLFGQDAKVWAMLLQSALVGLIVFCLLWVYHRTGEVGLGEMTLNFERTNTFHQTVEDIVRHKVQYAQNLELFETDGMYDEQKQIDIRQYASGITDPANSNVNTAYSISSLLQFADNGAEEMNARITRLLREGRDEASVGEALEADSLSLETILPVSGMSLADYASLSSNPARSTLEYYRLLTDCATDIANRYSQYTEDTREDSPNAVEAPSNVHYYIENTNTRQRYSNMGVNSLSAARTLVGRQADWTFLFEGERSFNIMVADPEYTLSEDSSQYFLQKRFTGTGEKVLLAVDLNYPIGDSLQRASAQHKQGKPYLYGALGLSALLCLILIILFIWSLNTNGRQEPGGRICLEPFDQIPTEIAAGLCLIVALGWLLLVRQVRREVLMPDFLHRLSLPVMAAVEYLILLLALLSFIRRWRASTLWSNSVCCAVVLGTRQVYSARARSQRLLVTFFLYCIFNIVFLKIGGVPGMLMFVVMNAGTLLYLMRDAVGNQNVREGLKQISTGRLDYRIRTDVLSGESREMGQAVNEMGDGLQQAVEKMLKGERAKAELITNLSHDIKTPLTSIINYVDLLKRERIQNERAQEYIHILEQKSARLKSLTEDLLEVSRISSGSIELHQEPILLPMFIRQICGECEEILEKRNITWQLELPSEQIWIETDGSQLFRVFENLTGNIGKYAKEGTKAIVKLSADEATARITLENESQDPITFTGEELQERFTRGDTSRKTEGSGLGLAIAGSLCSLLGGTFRVDVTKETFCAVLTFPRAADPGKKAGA
ncbi:MAG: HAMP domain-containing histidine kinase [Lachnospiraceae bacterium]|nr:HAMP domain-containing histidine kinase [Lachnospiraceae bacterium]